MFCSRCGAEVADTANFCSNCGLGIRGDTQPAGHPRAQWEWCGIESGYVESGAELFWVRVVGPLGEYEAARSNTFPGMATDTNNKAAVAAFYGLMAKLLEDGWEPYSEGDHFTHKRFKRPAAPAGGAGQGKQE